MPTVLEPITDLEEAIENTDSRRNSSLNNIHFVTEVNDSTFNIFVDRQLQLVFLGLYDGNTKGIQVKTDMLWPDDRCFVYNMARLYESVTVPAVKTYLTQVMDDFIICGNQIPKAVLNLESRKELDYTEFPSEIQFLSILNPIYESIFKIKLQNFAGYRLTNFIKKLSKEEPILLLVIDRNTEHMRLVKLGFKENKDESINGFTQVFSDSLDKPEDEREVITIESANTTTQNCLERKAITYVSSIMTSNPVSTQTTFEDLISGKINIDPEKKFHEERDVIEQYKKARKKIKNLCIQSESRISELNASSEEFKSFLKDWPEKNEAVVKKSYEECIQEILALNSAKKDLTLTENLCKEANIAYLLSSDENLEKVTKRKNELKSLLETKRERIIECKVAINKNANKYEEVPILGCFFVNDYNCIAELMIQKARIADLKNLLHLLDEKVKHYDAIRKEKESKIAKHPRPSGLGTDFRSPERLTGTYKAPDRNKLLDAIKRVPVPEEKQPDQTETSATHDVATKELEPDKSKETASVETASVEKSHLKTINILELKKSAGTSSIKEGSSTAVIVGISLTIGVLLTVLIIGVILYLKKRNRRNTATNENK